MIFLPTSDGVMSHCQNAGFNDDHGADPEHQDAIADVADKYKHTQQQGNGRVGHNQPRRVIEPAGEYPIIHFGSSRVQIIHLQKELKRDEDHTPENPNKKHFSNRCLPLRHGGSVCGCIAGNGDEQRQQR